MSSGNSDNQGLRFLIILILPLLLQILGQPAPGFAAKEIHIGEINPLSGHLAQHGQEIHQGILYAVEEVNSRGGIAGRRVKLISRDDQSKPEVAINQVQDLIFREHVVGLTGGYVDSLVGPVSELASRYRVPFVASASLQSGLTSRKNPYFFRVSRLNGIVQPLCRFISHSFPGQKVAVVHVATPGASEFASSIKSCLEGSGEVVPLREKFRPGWPDFSVLLLKVKQAGIEVFVSGGFFADNLILVRQMQERPLGLKAFVAPWGLAYPSFIREVGQGTEGLFGTCAWNPGITQPGTEKMSQDFVAGFRKRFGEDPNTTTMHGYTSARALLAAMETVIGKKVELTGEAISRALATLDLQLPMERLAFDEQGDPKYYQHAVVQIQKQKMVVVYPPGRATGKVDFSAARR